MKKTGFYRISEILEILPIGRSTFWRWVKEKRAPQPIKIGQRTTVWKAEDIHDFIDTLSNRGGSL